MNGMYGVVKKERIADYYTGGIATQRGHCMP